MNKLFWLTGIATLMYLITKSSEKKPPQSSPKRLPSQEEHDGFLFSRTPLPGGGEVLRFKGGYDDIMRSLGVIQDQKPALPEGLDIQSLPKYFGGCPHCGQRSLHGEGMWRYQELSRTRGYMDNTTTFLCKCKKCQGFMRATVDHDD